VQNEKSYHLRFMLSDLYANQNRTEESIRLLNDCLLLDKDSASPERLRAKNALAQVYLQRRELDASRKFVDDVLKDNPKDVDAHFTKGNIHLAQREGAAAVPEFRIVVSERPQFIKGYVRLAEAHAMNQETGLAVDTLQNALKVDPASSEVRELLKKVMVSKEAISDKEAVEKGTGNRQ